MLALVIGFAALLLVVLIRRRGGDEQFDEKMVNGASSIHLWDHILDQYGVPFGQFCIATIYSVYMNMTLLNLVVFSIKYVPTGVCMYKFVKNVYVTSRERLKAKEQELEDIQLQIKIMATKLCVREAECAERVEALRREAARLREARARVREAIAADDSLGPALERWADAAEKRSGTDDADLAELLKELRYERVVLAEKQNEMSDKGQPPYESPDNSVYSSLSDGDGKTDCRVRIVKVTNVYKVAYLKHYIKQKRLRRASKQALLKKKMESIKKLLEEWQRSLSMVINSKLSMLERDTSEEAAGDHSKPHSDSDAERSADTCDDYGSWANRNYYEEPDTAVSRSLYDTYEPQEYGDKYTAQCECSGPKGGHVLFLLPRLPEETSSQVAIAEIKDADDYDHDGFLTV